MSTENYDYYSLNKFVGNCGDSRDFNLVKKGLEENSYLIKNINGFDTNGQTALVNACQNGNVETVRILLINGANPTASNKAGQMPYEFANDQIEDLLNEVLISQNIFQNNT